MPLVAACQVPDIREDPDEALAWIETYGARAQSQGASLVCFPECFLQGYVIDEETARHHALNLKSAEFDAILRRLAKIKPALVFGLIEVDEDVLFNAAVVAHRGCLLGVYRKVHLLEGERISQVLEGERIFQAGNRYPVFEIDGLRFGINICFDTNFTDAAAVPATHGAAAIVCPANNMMRREKAEKWKDVHNNVRAKRAKETGCWIISSDVTGERDNRIALGPTAIIDPNGKVVAQVPLLEVGMVVQEI